MSCGSGKLCVVDVGRSLLKRIFTALIKPALFKAAHCKNLRHFAISEATVTEGFMREHLPLNSDRHFNRKSLWRRRGGSSAAVNTISAVPHSLSLTI